MEIRTNLGPDNCYDLGSGWTEEKPSADFISDMENAEYTAYGYGNIDFFELDLSSRNDYNIFLISGIHVFSDVGTTRFKKICLIIREKEGATDRWQSDDAWVETNNAVIEDLYPKEPYDEKAVLSMLEQYGYHFCGDIDDARSRYDEDVALGLTDLPFVEWLEGVCLIDEDQFGEPEFEGPQWIYANYLDWDAMADAFYSGGERWRSDQLSKLGGNDDS